jgi:hypothetical protein
MKSMRSYLITMAVFLFAAIIAGIVVWYYYQHLQSTLVVSEPVESGSDVLRKDEKLQASSTEEQKTIEPVTLTTESLSPGQRAVLESFGMEDTTVTVTETTIACAKDAVGENRFEEILSGVAPTPLEAVKLLPCARK